MREITAAASARAAPFQASPTSSGAVNRLMEHTAATPPRFDGLTVPCKILSRRARCKR